MSDSCDPMNCNPPGSSVHGILQARILVWVAMPSSRGPSNPGIKPRSPALQVDSLPAEQQGKPTLDALAKELMLLNCGVEKTLEHPLDCKEVNPEYSLEGLMLKLKLHNFGHLM